MTRNDKILTAIDKVNNCSIASLVFTVISPIILIFVNFKVWTSCVHFVSFEETLSAFIRRAAVVAAAALACVLLILLFNVMKYKAAKEFGAMSRSAVAVNTVFASLVILIPVGFMDYSVIRFCLYIINGGAGHSVGAELIVPGILYLILLAPSMIPQIRNKYKTVYQLKSMMTIDTEL